MQMPQIDHVYCEYCKRHEDAVLRLQELDGQVNVQEFFNVSRYTFLYIHYYAFFMLCYAGLFTIF